MPPNLPNPFVYGLPVASNGFFGRRAEVRCLLDGMRKNTNTVVVGHSQIGKSSLSRFIRHPHAQRSLQSSSDRRYVFIEIDCHTITGSTRPGDFWQRVISCIKRECEFAGQFDSKIEYSAQNSYDPFLLDTYFELLTSRGFKVVLLIDEFDVLLHHKDFNNTDFLGPLRSMSYRNLLAFIVLSRFSVEELNRQTASPVGSPFFNHCHEIQLGPFQLSEVVELIQSSLRGTGVSFSGSDFAFIQRHAGRHPYLVQRTAAALYELHKFQPQLSAAQRLLGAKTEMVRSTNPYYPELWRHCAPVSQQLLLFLALMEHSETYGRHMLDTRSAWQLVAFESELRDLASAGIVEEDTQGGMHEGRNNGAYSGVGWQFSIEGFAGWIYTQKIASHPPAELQGLVRAIASAIEKGNRLSEPLPMRWNMAPGQLRSSLHSALRLDSEVDAFCLDYFPRVQRQFTQGMEREQKLNLLLTMIDPEEIAMRLLKYRAESSTRISPGAAE